MRSFARTDARLPGLMTRTSGRSGKDLRPWCSPAQDRCTGLVFITDQITLAGAFPAACTRLRQLADGRLLQRASNEAYGEGVRGLVHGGPVSNLPSRGLAGVLLGHLTVLTGHNGCARLPLRWETAGPAGQFPVLDADITLVPDGEQATLVGLDGVYRIPPGAGLDPVIVQQAAAATMRSFLGRLAGAITDPATAPSEDSGLAAVWPGCWLLPALTTESRETLTAGWLWQAALTRPAAGRRPAARR